MRVAVVAESFLPHVNGVTQSVQRVLEHLRNTGHRAHVVAPSSGADTPKVYAGAPVTGLPSVGLPGYPGFRVATTGPWRLERLLGDLAPDVVHVASPFVLGHRASQAAARLGLPVVSIYQTEVASYASRYGLPQLEPLLWRHIKTMHNLATLTLAPSSFAADQLRDRGVDRVRLWGRGVDPARFHPRRASRRWRRRHAPQGHRIVLYVGRLAAEKQLEDLRVLADLPDTTTVIIGDGPKRAQLETQLPDAVFCGQQTPDQVATAMASADLFVHTGTLETFCQSIQQALASGTPVVAPGRGGPLDLISPSRNGWLYAPGDLAGLRAAVVDLLGDDRKRASFATVARAGVEHRTWPAVCDELLQHYRDAMALVGDRARPPVV